MREINAEKIFTEITSGTSSNLLQLAQQNNQAAWQDLCQLYRPLIRYWCRQSRVAESEADDIEQDVFRSVFSALSNFSQRQNSGSFRSWLWTITRNKIRDHFKNRSNKTRSVGGTDAHMMLYQVPDAEPADTQFENPKDSSVIHTALDIIRGEVKPHTFDAFWRSTIDGTAPDIIAQELGITVDSVYQAKARILRRLRHLLD